MTTLKAKVGGVWVPLGVASEPGQNEVYVSDSAPVDPNVELWYDTDDPGASFPNMPRGYVGHGVTSSQQGVTTAATWTDITGCSVTWTADPSRRYRISAVVTALKITATGQVSFGLTDAGGGTQLGGAVSPTLVANDYNTVSLMCHESGMSGSVTRKLRIYTSTNGVNVGMAGYPSYIIVEDIGAAGVSGGGVWTDALPKGLAAAPAYGYIGADTPITPGAPLDLTGLAATWTAINGRRYKIESTVHVSVGASSATIELTICDAANTVIEQAKVIGAANTIVSMSCTTFLPLTTSGAQTRKARLYVSGACNLIGSTTNRGKFIVTDEGIV